MSTIVFQISSATRWTYTFPYDRATKNETPIAEALIDRLDALPNSAIRSFMETPLLVSLLYRSYQFKPTIPIRKHIFYRQVYDSLFESHNLTKGDAYIHDKHSELDTDEMRQLLRRFAFTPAKLGQIEFDKDTVLKYLRDAIHGCPTGVTVDSP